MDEKAQSGIIDSKQSSSELGVALLDGFERRRTLKSREHAPNPRLGGLYRVLFSLNQNYDDLLEEQKVGRVLKIDQAQILAVLQDQQQSYEKCEAALSFLLARAGRLFIPAIDVFAQDHAEVILKDATYPHLRASLDRLRETRDTLELIVGQRQIEAKIIPENMEKIEGELPRSIATDVSLNDVFRYIRMVDEKLDELEEDARAMGVEPLPAHPTIHERNANILSLFNRSARNLYAFYGDSFWDNYQTALSLERVHAIFNTAAKRTHRHPSDTAVFLLLQEYDSETVSYRQRMDIDEEIKPGSVVSKIIVRRAVAGITRKFSLNVEPVEAEELSALTLRLLTSRGVLKRDHEWLGLIRTAREKRRLITEHHTMTTDYLKDLFAKDDKMKQDDDNNAPKTITDILSSQRARMIRLVLSISGENNNYLEHFADKIKFDFDRVLMGAIAGFLHDYPAIIANDHPRGRAASLFMQGRLQLNITRLMAIILGVTQAQINNGSYRQKLKGVDVSQFPVQNTTSLSPGEVCLALNEAGEGQIPIIPDLSELLCGLLENRGYPLGHDGAVEPEVIPLLGKDDSVEEEALKNIAVQSISDVLSSFDSPRYEQVLRLYYFDELTQDQIAKIMRVKKERVRQLIDRAIRKLRHPQRIKLLHGLDQIL